MSKAEATRKLILDNAFELVYRRGYQVTSIDDIIATTQVTKGAFYYHFKNKDEMGLAVINEVMYPGMYHSMVQPLLASADPVKEIYAMMKGLLLGNPFFIVQYGCPAVNLVEEMAPVNEQFRAALHRLIQQWQEAIQQCVTRGIASGVVRKGVNAAQVAFFVTAGYSGVRNMGKLMGAKAYQSYLKELKNYLAGLS